MKHTFKLSQCLIQSLCSLLIFFSLSAAAQQTEKAFTTVYRYDLSGKVTGVIKPDPDAHHQLKYGAVRNTYSASGLLTFVESGELSVWLNETYKPADWGSYFTVKSSKAFEYDGYGRKTKVWLMGTNGDIETLTQISYNNQGLVQCEAIRMNKNAYSSLPVSACDQSMQGAEGPDRITRYTYDELDQVTHEERGVGTPLAQVYVTNTYNGYLLTSQTDANGYKTDLHYDSYGRLTHRYYPSEAYVGMASTTDFNQYGYDANSNINMERKRNGAVINYTLDKNNRMIVKDYVDNTKQKDIYYDYDLRGLQLKASFGSATATDRTEPRYDGFGNQTRDLISIGGVGRTTWSKYDLNNNRVRVDHNDGKPYTYEYDGLDRLAVIYEGYGYRMLHINYKADGHRDQIVRRSSISTTNYSYTNGTRLDGFTQNFPNDAYDLTNNFQYNPAGQISQLTQNNSLYFYTGNENRTGAYLSDGLNRYTHIAGQPLGYDANSNLINDGSLTYQYDDENRLISTGGAVTSAFVYDPQGRLFKSTINNVTTYFVYEGDAVVMEYDDAGAIKRRYVHGDRVDEPLVQYNNGEVTGSSTKWYYLHADHQGSIIAQSNDQGSVLSTASYDSYGIPSNSNMDRFGYTGQMWFKELGLFYYKARWYHPKIGRFLQTDPIGYKDNMNLYAYVGNDPVNARDPSGMAKCAGSMSERDCHVAQSAANNARDTAKSLQGSFKGLAAKVRNGKVSAADQKQLDGLTKINKAFGTAKGLENLAKGMGKIADKIGASGEGIMLRNGDNKPNSEGVIPAGYVGNKTILGVLKIPSSKVSLNDGFFATNKSAGWRNQLLHHEAGHTAGYPGDTYGVSDVSKLEGDELWDNADTYTCAAYPSDC